MIFVILVNFHDFSVIFVNFGVFMKYSLWSNLDMADSFVNQGVNNGVKTVINSGFVSFNHSATAIAVLHFGSVKTRFCQFLTVEIRVLCFEGT